MDLTSEDIERWRYPRFFADYVAESAIITGSDAKHIVKVLRMKVCDKAIICDSEGMDCLGFISEISDSTVTFTIIDKRANEAEASINLCLYQCIPKLDKFDFIVQKATELGVKEIVPVLSKRCVSRPDEKTEEKKLIRYRKIAEEAGKQSGRSIIPKISSMVTFTNAISTSNCEPLRIICYECGGEPLNCILNDNKYKNIDIVIGSEGGFEAAEVENAVKNGFKVASLGKRILRCETAPIAAISIVMNLTNNM